MEKIVVLGTGHAMTAKCYNTCFVYQNGAGAMLVDTGGGQQLVGRMRETGISAGDIDCVFISHAHTDHLLGLPWLIRMRMRDFGEKQLKIIAHPQLCKTAKELLWLIFPDDHSKLERGIRFCPVEDGDEIEACGCKMLCYDTLSERCRQFGFAMTLENGKKFVFNGDVPYVEENHTRMADADYLVHEAFCLEKNWHNKGHTCVAVTAQYAARLNAKKLIIVHCGDDNYECRREEYTREAAAHFGGEIFVPYDLESIALD